VTKDGTLWTFGSGDDGALGHNDRNNRLVQTRIEAQHFCNAKIVSVASGISHSAAVTEEGTLYTWGQASGLGHATPMGRQSGCPRAMGAHPRLGNCAAPTAMAAGGSSQRRSQRQQGKTPAAADKGKDCEYVTMPGELVQRVVEACASWPVGRAGELEGVVRLLGGGMMQARGST